MTDDGIAEVLAVVRREAKDAANLGELERFADALEAEASLPERRPNWKRQALERARRIQQLVAQLHELLEHG